MKIMKIIIKTTKKVISVYAEENGEIINSISIDVKGVDVEDEKAANFLMENNIDSICEYLDIKENEIDNIDEIKEELTNFYLTKDN